MIVGKATPKHARMMCQPSETAICCRAGSRPGGPSSDASTSATSLSHIAQVPYQTRTTRNMGLGTPQYTATASRTGVGCGDGGLALSPSLRERTEVIAIDTVAPKLHQPASQVRITDEAEAERFLEEAYGVKLRLRWNREQRQDDALLTHRRRTAGTFVVDDVYLAGEVHAAPDPLNLVVGIWPTSGNVRSDCDGMAGEAAADEVALLSQPDLPYRSSARDLRATAVLLDPAVVASVAAGFPNGQAPLPIRFSSLQPVDAAAARLWKSTVT